MGFHEFHAYAIETVDGSVIYFFNGLQVGEKVYNELPHYKEYYKEDENSNFILIKTEEKNLPGFEALKESDLKRYINE